MPLPLLAHSAVDVDDARRLFHRFQDAIYQIRIIEKESGNKAAIGSGFQVDASGLIVSNFHVIAEATREPDQYVIEYLAANGRRGSLALLAIDVVNDLAILRQDQAGERWLQISDEASDKGARIFSLGNPHDLGMTVIEGTYNGIVDHSLYQRVLFSGSLNPGMSGGPSVNREGEVIGVNVSTAGNQLSFLVPVSRLRPLLAEAESLAVVRADWDAVIEHQLVANQHALARELLDSGWQTDPLGEVSVPAEITGYVRCWGDTRQEPKQFFKVVHRTCNVEDAIYLSPEFTTGSFHFQYQWLETSMLNRFQFYSQMEKGFYLSEANQSYEQDVTGYECSDRFVNVGKKDWKVHFCARRYKRFPSLFDISLSMASLAYADRGMLVNFAMAGVNRSNARHLTQRLLESVQWN